MTIIRYARQAFKKCDLFCTTHFLRYKEEPEYKTASGGICSILVVAIFIGLFMNTAILTVNKKIINYVQTHQFIDNPTPTQISVDPSNSKFMFAVQILGMDLNDPTQRYFDISIVQHHYQVGIETYRNTIPMVQCTQQHLNINDKIYNSFNTLPASQWLCPPLGYNYTIYGKYSSQDMQGIEINLKKCSNSSDPQRPCASDATINQLLAQMGKFYFDFYYVNPSINPGDTDYLNYYLQDRNYLAFTPKLGCQSNGYIQQYSIVTDDSLMPLPNNVQDKGIIIPDYFQNIAYQVVDDTYASFFLLKAGLSSTYQRSFNKIDSFFSYVGGLVGTILGLMLIVQKYTEMSYELDLSMKMFQYKENNPNNFIGFTLLTYCKFVLYVFLNYFGFCKNWQEMAKYDECKQEMIKQLDIQLLLNRINFLERAIITFFDQDQIYWLHLQKLDTLDDIKNRRESYKINYKAKQHQNIASNQVLANQLDSNNTQQDKKSQKNTSIIGTNDMMKRINNTNIDQLNLDNVGEIIKSNYHQVKKTNRKQRLQRLYSKIQKGNIISKKIYQGIDPIYLEEIKNNNSPVKKQSHGQSKVQLVQIRPKQRKKVDVDNHGIDFQMID